jgi:hypothetical protein
MNKEKVETILKAIDAGSEIDELFNYYIRHPDVINQLVTLVIDKTLDSFSDIPEDDFNDIVEKVYKYWLKY